jgi:hypothetical protein
MPAVWQKAPDSTGGGTTPAGQLQVGEAMFGSTGQAEAFNAMQNAALIATTATAAPVISRMLISHDSWCSSALLISWCLGIVEPAVRPLAVVLAHVRDSNTMRPVLH